MNKSEKEIMLNIAIGCLDYCGGYRDKEMYKAFQHGIQTVISALEKYCEKEFEDTQTVALYRMGKEGEQ